MAYLYLLENTRFLIFLFDKCLFISTVGLSNVVDIYCDKSFIVSFQQKFYDFFFILNLTLN